jgi:DNA-binding CsgD family transcriptional regulator/PAS domain-containing protein
MQQIEALPDLIESIYDAALQPSRWNEAVVGINRFIGTQACGVFSKDAVSKFGVTHYYCGADPRFIQLYAETYSQFDPLVRLPRFGHVTGIPDLVSYEDYRKGRFYQEWLAPQGCADAANVVIENSNPKCPVLFTALPPKKRMVDAEMRRRIALVVPHAHRALMINKAIEVKQSEASGFADALDGLSAGVFLVDGAGGIVHGNSAGQAMLAEGDILRSVGGLIVISDAGVNRRLREILAVARDKADAIHDSAFPLIADDGTHHVAHVLPLRSVVRGIHGPNLKAVAALFVRKAELGSGSCGTLLARTFELTPTELRVLRSIVEIGGVPETAQELGIAETTVKTHLHRVFSKTGTNRQADLVRLAAGFASPLLN